MSEEVVAPVTPAVAAVAVETPVAPSTDYSTMFGADGSFTEDFYTSLPDDLGSHSSIKQMKNVVDLAKSYQNTKGLVGKKLEEFWTSEDAGIVAKRQEIMGIPKDAAGYEIALPEVPENVPYDTVQVDKFKEFAAENGIPADLAQKLVNWDAERATTAMSGMQDVISQQTQEAEDGLKKEWGPKFDYNVSKVQQATDHLGITETVNSLGLGRSPEFLKMVMEKIVPAISNDALVESQQKDTLATVTDNLNEVDSKIDKYEGSTREPEYQALVKQRLELLQRITT
jgi:hypothetical protein